MSKSLLNEGSAGARIEAESGVEKTDGDPPLKNSDEEIPFYKIQAERRTKYRASMPSPLPNQGTKEHDFLENFRLKVEVILQTVNENEYQAATIVLEKPDDMFERAVVFPKGGMVVGMFAKKRVALIQTDVGVNAFAFISDAIATFFNALYIIGVGVCYSFNSEKYKLGDVLVSKHISNLANTKWDCQDRFENRDETVHVVQNLHRIFCRDLVHDPQFKVCKSRNSEVYSGTIISYPTLIDNKEVRDKIHAEIRTAIGGEMEGGQLLWFQQKRKIEGIIVIKGICDYADGNKRKDWQFISALAALHYTKSKLMNEPQFLDKNSVAEDRDRQKLPPNEGATGDGLGENISSLSPTAHGDLRQQLQANLEAIQDSFADYVACIQESLLKKGVELGELKSYLIRLPCRDSDWNLTLLSVEKENIMQATNICEIFIFLDDFTSFLNYHIFEKLVTKFELNNGQECLKYPVKLRKYIEKHTISEFIEVHPVLNNHTDGTKKLVLILDLSLTSKLAKLVNIGNSVAQLMNLDQSALLIHNIEKRCVVITFLIPIFVADEIFTGHPTCIFSIDQKEKFRNLSIQQLCCNGCDFDFTSEETGRAPEEGDSGLRKPERNLFFCTTSLKRVNGSQEDLISLIKRGKIIRVGSTIDPDRRLREYSRDGYCGTMLFAETQNMKKAENRILKECSSGIHNIQVSSNGTEKPGYVYGIAKALELEGNTYCLQD